MNAGGLIEDRVAAIVASGPDSVRNAGGLIEDRVAAIEAAPTRAASSVCSALEDDLVAEAEVDALDVLRRDLGQHALQAGQALLPLLAA